MRRILALDLGTKCGWALGGEFGRRVASGTWILAPERQRRFEGGGMRWLRLRQFLDETMFSDATAPQQVVFEEVRRHMGVDAAHAYGAALGIVTSWCEGLVLPYRAVPVGTIKKFATGKGNALKLAMIAAAKIRWGVDAVDDNEADAVALLYLAMEGAK